MRRSFVIGASQVDAGRDGSAAACPAPVPQFGINTRSTTWMTPLL